MESWGIITAKGGGPGIIPHLRRAFFGALVMAVPAMAPAAEPVIDTFAATPAVVRPGEAVALAAQAHDPDCPGSCTSGCGQYIRADLTQWNATLGTFENIDNGASGSPYTASAVWRAPSAEGTATVTLTLSDSGTLMCGGRQTASAQVVITVSANAGQEPVITSLTVDRDPVLVGGTAELHATAEDPQGDPITFSWSAALGSVTPGSGGTATYHAPPDPGRETVTCTASDPGGASSSKTLEFTVTAALPEAALDEGLVTPHGVAANGWGDLVVADRGAGGLIFVNPATGEALRVLSVPRITSVAADWLDRIVVGTQTELMLLSPGGTVQGILDPGAPLGAVTGIAVDPIGHRIWALFGSTGRVVAFDGSGAVVRAWGARGEEPGQFHEPVALAWSPAGEVLVADEGLAQVLAFDPAGNFLGTIGSFGGGPGEFTRIAGLVVGPGNTLFASDAFQSRIQVFGPGGEFQESLGTFGEGIGAFKVPMGITLLDSPPRLAVASAQSSSIQVFRLDGTPVQIPQATADPGTLDFGEIVVGRMSAPEIVRLTNTGTVPVGIYGLESPAAFAVETTCGAGLAPGQSCTATVIFNPFRAGRSTGTLRFLCSGQGDQAVALVGRGIPDQAPQAALSPETVVFGPVPVGHTSGIHTITLSNIGGGLLDVTSTGIDGDGASQFAVAVDQCTGKRLASGETCTVEVRFSPAVVGSHNAVLAFETSGGATETMLSGEALEAVVIPVLGGWGTGLMVVGLALLGWITARRRFQPLPLCTALAFLLGSSVVLAVDPPHWYFDMDCQTCHTGHNAAGGTLTAANGNSNLCLSCHTEGGRASALPILPSHTLAEHHYNVTPDAARWGSQMPTNPEMADRIMDGLLVCSTCHDQHSARASNRGRLRVSTPERLTALGSTGEVSVGGNYTGAGGSSYLVEITIADSHFRFSKDGGATWVGEADIGADIPLDNGLTVTFSGGSFALGERWRFSASYPFLRLPLDQGDNTNGDRFCRECHSLWAMDHEDVEGPSTQWMSHPVGDRLNANGRGYDRPVPLDGNGAVQGTAGADGNESNDFNLDAENMVQCMTCHGIHYADSNTLTEDGP